MPARERCPRWAVRPIFASDTAHVAEEEQAGDNVPVLVAVVGVGLLVDDVAVLPGAVTEPGADGRFGLAVGVVAGHATRLTIFDTACCPNPNFRASAS